MAILSINNIDAYYKNNSFVSSILFFYNGIILEQFLKRIQKMISQDCKVNETNYRFPNIPQWIRTLIKPIVKRYKQLKESKHNPNPVITMADRMRKDIGLRRTDMVRIGNAQSFKVMFQPELNDIKTGRTRAGNDTKHRRFNPFG